MLKQIQAGTGLIFFVFLVVHLLNTWLMALGAGVYDSVQIMLRSVYQFAPIEALLLAALAVHMIVGVVRIVTEPKRTLSRRAKWHRYAGFFLMVFIFGHVLAVRGASWFFDVYPGFLGLAFSVDYVPYYFYPYYFLLGMAGFYHGLNGASIAVGRLGGRFALSQAYLTRSTGVAGVLFVVALLALGGFLFEIEDVSNSEFGQLALELVS